MNTTVFTFTPDRRRGFRGRLRARRVGSLPVSWQDHRFEPVIASLRGSDHSRKSLVRSTTTSHSKALNQPNLDL